MVEGKPIHHGKYEPKRRIATGGMTEIYAARAGGLPLVNSRFNINRHVTVDVTVNETVRKKFEFPVPQ